VRSRKLVVGVACSYFSWSRPLLTLRICLFLHIYFIIILINNYIKQDPNVGMEAFCQDLASNNLRFSAPENHDEGAQQNIQRKSRLAEAVADSEKSVPEKTKKKNSVLAPPRKIATPPRKNAIEPESAVRPGNTDVTTTTSPSGLETTTFKKGSIQKTIFVPVGLYTKELYEKYGRLQLGNKYCFMIFDFEETYDLGKLIGRKGSVKESIIERSRDKNKNAELSIHFSKSSSESKWCVVWGNVDDVVRSCSKYVSKYVSLHSKKVERKDKQVSENGRKSTEKDTRAKQHAKFAELEHAEFAELEALLLSNDATTDDIETEKLFNGTSCEEAQEEYDEYETDANDDDSSDDDSTDPDSASPSKCAIKTTETNKDGKITIQTYVQEFDKGLAKACTSEESKGSIPGPIFSDEMKANLIDFIQTDLRDEGDRRANKIDFVSIENVRHEWRAAITEAFAEGFGIQSGEQKERLVNLVDRIIAENFDIILADINSTCKKNVEASRSAKEPSSLDLKNFVFGEKDEIERIIREIDESFNSTYGDGGVHESATAYEEAYKVSQELPRAPPAPATGNVFLVMSGPVEKLFDQESIYEGIQIDTGVCNVMNPEAFLGQLEEALKKANQKGMKILLSKSFNVTTYPVATIPADVNKEEIEVFKKNRQQYALTHEKESSIPLPPNFSWLKERLRMALCYNHEMADFEKCLTKSWLQHTIKKMVEVARETFKAALEKEEREKTVIIEIHIDLTRLRGPGNAAGEKAIQKYAKKEMLLNMKVAMDFASERGFRITVSSRWFFKRLVEYIQGSSTCIGEGYNFLGANGGEQDLLADEADELSSVDEEDVAISKVLKTELHAARGTVFKLTATNAKNDKLVEVYNHRHLSQALRKGGNTTLFAIAILKLVVVFGLPLDEAIQRARSTYYFSNLLARSVVLSFLETKKATEGALNERCKLASFDLSVFLNPDALKRLVCILHSKLNDERRSPVVDSNNNAAQLQAWKEFNKRASGTPAPKDLINPEFFACSMSQLIGLFSSATRVFLGSGNGEQYDFRRIGSIARLKWRQNVTYGVRDALRAKREQENELDDSDYTARVERWKFKIKLAKSSSGRSKTPNDDDDDDERLQKTRDPLFPLRDEDIPSETRKCVTCGRTTSSTWFNSNTVSNKFNCKNCYSIERAASANKKCVACGATKSGQWIKSASGQDNCRSCYQREHYASANKTCVTCNETTSCCWYNLKTDPPTSKCKKCYNHAEYAARKKRKREEERERNVEIPEDFKEFATKALEGSLSSFTVDKLKTYLDAHGLTKSGSKAALVSRIEEHARACTEIPE